MKTILCYGDSNTWGDNPAGPDRYGHNIRWPRVLQELLGNDYYVVEEGLCGRTTDLDDKGSHNRNGLNYLPACIKSHSPIDYMFLMLGTNDLKDRFNRSATDIAEAVGRLVDTAKEIDDSPNMKITILSPAPIDVDQPRYSKYGEDFVQGVSKSFQLAIELKKIADEKDCSFIDISEFAKVGEDGLHLTENSHKVLAEKLSEYLKHRA